MKTSLPPGLAAFLSLAALLTFPPPGASGQSPSAVLRERCEAIVAGADRSRETERLQRLFDAHWQYTMEEFPEEATWVGHPGQNHRWTDYSLAAIERRREDIDFPWRALQSIDRSRLPEAQRLNHDLFRRQLEVARESRRFPSEFLPLSQMHGIQREAASMLAMMPKQTVSDFENMIARLTGLAPLIDQTLVLLKEGVKRGITPPRVPLRDIAEQVEKQLVEEPIESPLLRPFHTLPKGFDNTTRKRLKGQAIEAFERHARPAFERLHDYLTAEYLPACRESIALGDLPDGEAWYSFQARRSTTTDLTPREIHEIGLREVKRIRAEMEAIKERTGFQGTLPEFFDFLRTDEQFFYDRPAELLAGYREICKRVDPELIRLFGRLPRQPYGIKPVPSYIEKSVTTAYYQPGSTTAGRPGYFFANTYDLGSRPKWEMVALSLHEAVPGHHLQLAIADELENVPMFRKYGRYTAFVEGWGLYSESLGEEMGMYDDPYQKFGQLTYEMWRAIRLVVDTGIHALGWSRQQAIDFFKANAGKAEHDITVEIDRYIVWPGQALAYKIGQLKISELRARAQKQLGEDFDLRAFHDTVLGAGAVPLDILEHRIDTWIAAGRK